MSRDIEDRPDLHQALGTGDRGCDSAVRDWDTPRTGTHPRMAASSNFRPVGAATPLVEATAGVAAAALFATTSAIRRARTFHPLGVAFHATFTVDAPARHGAGLVDTPGSHDAIVRLSRGVGLHEPWPDVLGFALRILDARGPGEHQDLLLVTAGDGPIGRRLFIPSIGFGGNRFSSVLPYRLGDRKVLFGARCVDDERLLLADLERDPTVDPVRFVIEIAEPLGSWEPVAEVELGERLPDDTAESLAFNPANTGVAITPVGVVQAVRRLSYLASQATRPR